MTLKRLTAGLLALAISGTACAANDWTSTLLPRDLDGNAANGPEAYYDTLQDLTWMADWSAALRVDFQGGRDWADGLTLGGHDDWRLPAISLASSCQAYNCTNSEFGRLWYGTLGNVAPGAESTGPFRNVTSGPYWLAPQASAAQAWEFAALSGFQALSGVGQLYVAVAVRSGDTLPVPEPSAVVLLAAGLAALGGWRRVRR